MVQKITLHYDEKTLLKEGSVLLSIESGPIDNPDVNVIAVDYRKKIMRVVEYIDGMLRYKNNTVKSYDFVIYDFKQKLTD